MLLAYSEIGLSEAGGQKVRLVLPKQSEIIPQNCIY